LEDGDDSNWSAEVEAQAARDPFEDVFPRESSLLADDPNEDRFARLEDPVHLEKLLRPLLERRGTLEVTGLLEEKRFQRWVRLPEGSKPEIGSDLLLVLRDGLLALLVGGDQGRREVELNGGERHQLIEDLEGPLVREAVEESDEAELVGKPEPIPGASALLDFVEVAGLEHRLALELSLRVHSRPSTLPSSDRRAHTPSAWTASW